jgi:integrase
MPKTKTRRHFGSTRKLPSGKVQARYVCPTCTAMHPAHTTFDTLGDAGTWLEGVRTDIVREKYVCPAERRTADEAAKRARQTFGEFSEAWLSRRDVKPRTRLLYRRILDVELLPTFGAMALSDVTRNQVEDWWHTLPSERRTGNAHAYALLRTIMGSAEDQRHIPANPCKVKGAGPPKRQRQIKPATLDELRAVADAMPDRLEVAVWLAAFCALRFGELVELRRRDVDLTTADLTVLDVSRAVVYLDGRPFVSTPKSAAGVRRVVVPDALRPALLRHLQEHAQDGPDGLLFSAKANGRACPCGYAGCIGGHLDPTALYKHFHPAREAAGRSDLRWHDLRHTGAVMAAQEGASLAELMARLGHSTVSAALRYQHAADGRDAEIARRLSRRLTL